MFESPIVETIKKEQWQNVVREMPMGMTKSNNTVAVNEKVIYIYTCFNGVAITEWINIYKAVIEFIQVLVNYGIKKYSQETVKVNIKGGRGGKTGKGVGKAVADKYDKYNNVHKLIILCKSLKTKIIIKKPNMQSLI